MCDRTTSISYKNQYTHTYTLILHSHININIYNLCYEYLVFPPILMSVLEKKGFLKVPLYEGVCICIIMHVICIVSYYCESLVDSIHYVPTFLEIQSPS